MEDGTNFSTSKRQRDNGTNFNLELRQWGRKVSWQKYNAGGLPENGFWRAHFNIRRGYPRLQINASEGYTNDYGKVIQREVQFQLDEEQSRALFETLKAVFEPDLTTAVEWTVTLARVDADPATATPITETSVFAVTEKEATRLAHEWATENGRRVWSVRLASDTF